jgi:RTX calcium-binding nonapeptide repeat (4 copies)
MLANMDALDSVAGRRVPLLYGRSREEVLRKLATLLSSLVLTLVLASGVALAADFIGNSGDDELMGTEGNDYLEGRAGDDRLVALGGDDIIYGGKGTDRIDPGEGADQVYAGAGDDLIYARDTASFDYIDCGGGFDQVETIHRDDVTKSNCERAWGPRKGDIPR